MQKTINNNPSISVIMPVYNVAPYVERCLLSVMRQTWPATECIIVDDGSTDDSIDRCQRLIDDYQGTTHFIILRHSHNRGLSAARNTGTDAATSEYIYYLDSDDEVTHDCLEKMVAPVVEDDSIEMVLGAYMVDLKPIKVMGRRISLQHVNFLKDMPSAELRTNEEVCRWYYKCIRPICVWNKLLKLAFVKANDLYNKEGLLFEDTLWTFNLIRCLSRVAFVHSVTYLYHRNDYSIRSTTTVEEKNRQFAVSFREMTSQLVPGERMDETVRWAFLFGNCYIDASGDSDYQHFHDIYRRELSNGGQCMALCRLTLIHYLGKSRLGRRLFKSAARLTHLIKRSRGLMVGIASDS